MELESTAVHEAGTSNAYDFFVFMDFILDDEAAAAIVQTSFSGIADATPMVAQGGAGSSIDCDFVNDGCSAPSLPASLAFQSGVLSSTLDIAPNAVTVNNVTTETGRVGGEETLGPGDHADPGSLVGVTGSAREFSNNGAGHLRGFGLWRRQLRADRFRADTGSRANGGLDDADGSPPVGGGSSSAGRLGA